MHRVTSPGLPPWPPLKFDSQSGCAVVKFRGATWRSHVLAARTMQWAVLPLLAGLGIGLWNVLSIGDPVLKFWAFISVFCPLMVLAVRIGKEVFPVFLARQVFASRVEVRFMREAILFKSPMYQRGVIVWRTWKGHPIRMRFALQPDENAQLKLESKQQRDARASMELRMAQRVDIVIASFGGAPLDHGFSSGNILRTIPLCEVSGAAGTKVTMVLTAAAVLTRCRNAEVPTGTDREGRSIDAID